MQQTREQNLERREKKRTDENKYAFEENFASYNRSIGSEKLPYPPPGKFLSNAPIGALVTY